MSFIIGKKCERVCDKLFMEHQLDSSKNVEELIKIHKKIKNKLSFTNVQYISSNMNKVFVEKDFTKKVWIIQFFFVSLSIR